MSSLNYLSIEEKIELGYKRLNLFAEIYPEIAVNVSEFCNRHPEFLPYLLYLPFKLKENIPPKTVKQGILYYICCAGLNFKFAKELYFKIKDCKSEDELLSKKVPPSKLESLSQAIKFSDEITLEQALEIKIKGIGIGGTNWLKNQFGQSFDLNNFQYTDLCLQKGLQKIYNLPSKPTSDQSKKIGESWGNLKGIGQLFCFQANSYA